MSKPKGRLKQTQSQRQRPLRSDPSILFLSLIVIIVVASSSSSLSAAAAAEATAPIQYYVNLPKVGLISGLTIDPRGPQVEFANQQQQQQQQQRQQQVVGFLGIPYAAPPIGPLRFMPPGALQQQQQLQPQSGKQKQQQQQLVLMPNGQRSTVRSFNRLGSRCIHLADWLSNNNKQQQQPDASRANDHQDNNQQQQQQQDQFLQQQQLQQSEDCLNLNVFVPIKAANGNQQQTITGGRSDHAQFGHQGPANHQRTTEAATTTTTTTTTAQDSRWSPPAADGKLLPILVVIQAEEAVDRTTTTNRPAAIDDPAKLASSTESIVITFNYRTGLLGFLPYADYDETGNNKRQSQPIRYNHAIWDQIGLLHWLKRNVHAFGGDPNTITLAGADSRASLRLQLLCMSPLAKGLFNRAVLLQRQRGCGNDLSTSATSQQLDVRQLIETGGKIGRDLRQRLSSSLTEIVSNLNLSQTQGVYEVILSADIHQLAQIEHELQQKVPQKVLLMVNEPSLDDNLLFPHLGPFIDYMKPLGSSNSLALRSLQSELNYCSYIRRIYQTNSNSSPEDPLHLIPRSDSEMAWNRTTNSTTTNASAGWHRDPNQNRKSIKISVSNQQKSPSRTMAVQYFNHLNHLSSLNRILATTSQQKTSGLSEDEMDGAAEDEVQGDNSVQAKRVERRDLRRSELSGKRQHANEMQSIEDTNRLAELLSSIDLMFGYISCSSGAAPAAYDHQHQKVAANGSTASSFGSRLAESLLNVTSKEHSIDNNLVAWLKWIDFHSVLSAAAAASSNINIGASQYCDLSSLLASTMIGNGSSPAATTPTTAGLKNSFVFVINDDNTVEGSLLSKSVIQDSVSERIKFGLENFIKFGDANHNHKPDNHSNSWPNYNTLSREFEPVQMRENEYRSMKEQLLIQLDIVPYLSEDLPKLLIGQNNNNRSTAVIESSQHKNPVHALLASCLGDLESDLAAAEQSSSSIKRNCLTSSLSKLRSLTRRYAAQDLEPLLIRVASRNSNNNQVSDFGPGKSSGTSSITTRNLVNQTPDLDDETLMGSEESHNSLVLSNGTNGGLIVGRQLSGESRSALTGDESLLKRFLGITFKDTVGRALTIVVVTGLVIFLINLIIVIVMALRSSNRGSPSNNNNNNDGDSKTSTNKVYDSGRGPNAAATVGKSILLQQQAQPSVRVNQGNDQSQQDDCLSSSVDKEIPANQSMLKLASSLRKASSSTTSNGFPVDAKNTRRPQASRTTKQLKFNLANDSLDTEDQHQHQHHDHSHPHPHNQMIELSELVASNDDDSKLILDASPLLDVSQYLIPAQSTYPEAMHLNECASHHHHHHHQQPFDLNPIDTCAVLTASRGKFVQSPCNQSLTTTSASNTTSSTLRQNGGSLKRIAPMDGHAEIHHQHQHQHHHNQHPLNGAQAYSSHSPNSSTTLSMTPNQQTDSLNLGYPQQQPLSVTLDPSTYHHHHQNQNHLHSHSSTSFEVDQSQQFYMSESELFNTLKRQHKVHLLNDDPYQHQHQHQHHHHNHPQN